MADASAPHGNLTGEQVYGQVCKTCHDAGLAGAPKTGDKAAWTPRIAQGEKTLVTHAIAGFQGKVGVMPPRGGNADLTDDEVHRAVVYLANQAAAGWKEPAPAAVAAAPAAPAAPAPAAAAAPAVAAASPPPAPAAAPALTATAAAAPAGGKADGKAIYDKTCAVCHATGLAGAPKFGDKAAWAPRIATGADALHNSALHGKNAMPPKGGNLALTDADVIAAVDYMASAAQCDMFQAPGVGAGGAFWETTVSNRSMLIETRFLYYQLAIRAPTDVVGRHELRVEIDLDRGNLLGVRRIVVPNPA
jgi:cytochrome c5